MTPNILTVVFMRIQVFQVVNAVSACLVPSTLKVIGTSKTTGTAYTVAQHHIPEYSHSHYVTCCEHIGKHFHKRGIKSSRGFYNSTVLYL